MKINRQILVEKIKNYLNHQLSLDELIDWAENGLMEADLPAKDAPKISAALAQIGLMNVREFGLTWEECDKILHEMGYTAHIELHPA
ncbi:MAG: hypothetical protein WD552_01140 [Candidatus Paceibacterota bacterium]